MRFIEERLVFSRHGSVKVSWMKYQVYRVNGGVVGSFSPPFSVSLHKTFASSSRINAAVLFIIIILAVLFFISGLLHLLVRFLTKHNSSSGSHNQSIRLPDGSPSDALQRQLQQLFHLHDSGLDQTFIDVLPVFSYKEVVGANGPFDCAVCLCEFSENDNLRLLPTCSHAFHINCIDTWLLSNSSCPLCRNTLFDPGFSMYNPMFDFDYPREVDESGLSAGLKTMEPEITIAEKGVFSVRLGKFRKMSEGESETVGETSSSNLDARRCYSMGSYAFVVGDTNLLVPLSHPRDLPYAKFLRDVERAERMQSHMLEEDIEGKKINIGAKTDSFSVSKIWLWSKKRKFTSSSETQMHNPSSIDMELPRMGRLHGT